MAPGITLQTGNTTGNLPQHKIPTQQWTEGYAKGVALKNTEKMELFHLPCRLREWLLRLSVSFALAKGRYRGRTGSVMIPESSARAFVSGSIHFGRFGSPFGFGCADSCIARLRFTGWILCTIRQPNL